MINKFFAVIGSFLLMASAASAMDEGLYEPAPPANSAFVRVIHANPKASSIAATLGGKGFGKLTYPAISKYVAITAGDQTFEATRISEKIMVEAGQYYTLAVVKDNAVKVIDDAVIGNPAKARLYFYNLSDVVDATLFAPKQKAAIISKQEANSGTSREINALTLPLQILAEGKLVKQFDGVQLKRRMGTTAALFGSKGAYKALVSENAVAR